MGWCHEFGPQITAGCGHPMLAGRDMCTCSVCGVACTGRFAGCEAVWARGPQVLPPHALDRVNGPQLSGASAPGAAARTDGGAGPIVVEAAPVEAVPATSATLTAVVPDLQRHDRALERLARAVRRLTDVTEALPSRVEAAMNAAMAGAGQGPAGSEPTVPAQDVDVRASLDFVRDSVAALRAEVAEVALAAAAAPMPEPVAAPPAPAVSDNGDAPHNASGPANGSAAPPRDPQGREPGSFSAVLSELTARPEWKAVRGKLLGRSPRPPA